ncbi:MAG: DUF1934 domain-containing protein [Erysipelotrichaceae bacterium]
MKKFITVKQKNLDTNETNVLYEGIANIEKTGDTTSFAYVEQEQEVRVVIEAKIDQLRLQRQGELSSNLLFVAHKTTSNELASVYGVLHVDIYTHEYIHTQEQIVVDYDVLSNGETTDSFQILITIEEVRA